MPTGGVVVADDERAVLGAADDDRLRGEVEGGAGERSLGDDERARLVAPAPGGAGRGGGAPGGGPLGLLALALGGGAEKIGADDTDRHDDEQPKHRQVGELDQHEG